MELELINLTNVFAKNLTLDLIDQIEQNRNFGDIPITMELLDRDLFEKKLSRMIRGHLAEKSTFIFNNTSIRCNSLREIKGHPNSRKAKYGD